MIYITQGTVFNTPAQAIVNTVNTDGFMGAGLALEFALRYPDMLEVYKEACKDGSLKVGILQYYPINDKKIIINFPTKWHYQYPSKLIWVREGLEYFKDTYRENDVDSVAFPKLGCSNGGLNWEKDVRPMIEEILGGLNLDIYLCEDTKKEAEGREKDMVFAYNDSIECSIRDHNYLIREIGLSRSPKAIDSLLNYGKTDRFWKLSKIPGITSNVYAKLFRYYYEQTEDHTVVNKPIDYDLPQDENGQFKIEGFADS